ncbi:MAG: excinuclease ABC subunit UvrC [Clostridiales bacterium]|nr:excinuclease ABC subunit UvrC [Clostridiales bacterium]
MNEKLRTLRKKAMNLPLTPGVYIMKDSKGRVIYVGKAKALKNRVSQYFGSQNNHQIKVIKMVENVADFDYVLCDSEFEALVLECSLIKHHSPKYNILLKDDKGYNYIKVTNGEWRTISAVKQKLNDGAEYIGPYTGSYTVTSAVDEALKIFRLPQCSKSFPRDCGKSRPCLNYFINQCCAPCSGKVSHEQYSEAVNDAIDFIKGGSAAALRDLHKRMEEAAEGLDFERAARMRDRIAAIKKLNEKQKVVSTGSKVMDVFAVAEEKEKACLTVLRFDEGRLYDSEHFIIERPENPSEARRELIRGFYSIREKVPPKICIDAEVEDTQLITQWLSSLAGRKVNLVVPQRGEQAQLVEMCRKNAAEKLAQTVGRAGRETAALDELAKLLGLSSPPEYIEAYDISHTAGSDNVGGMVVYKNGAPLKSSYRRFAIKGFSGQDDYASMSEVLTRRFQRYVDEGESESGFGKLPDLILLDGGQGQLHAVLPVLKQFGLNIPVFGMVKDSSHRTRAIASDGGEIAINSKRQAFTLVSGIQQEVHRYSVEYHRKKHKSSSLSTTLTSIEGIGETRAKALLRHFKTLKAIAQADIEDLKKVKGMNEKAANAVYTAFREE